MEARKAFFDMHKVFITCTFVYSNMVINYDKFKFFMSKYRNKKKLLLFRAWVRFRVWLRVRVRVRVRFKVFLRVRIGNLIYL